MYDKFLQAMSKTANSVCVVTTDGLGDKVGVTVSAMTSVSAEDPHPSILICIHGLSPACAAIQVNRVFCANVLTLEQSCISDRFAGRTGAKGRAKFEGAEWVSGTTGVPVLANALASFECNLVHSINVGSHHIFVGSVLDVRSTDNGEPLVYHNRHYAALNSAHKVH